jgi:hypothetical protein
LRKTAIVSLQGYATSNVIQLHTSINLAEVYKKITS